ncbi:hypothetical protein [Kibdelosporangium aridum]|uniref:Uncharacterized protein n=1 Tax=Kibdelosporangium aridum TaxID=2030 RepID=A0A1W2FY33_KIBAR|nr:hypothetical protein [Kibdelosporangium aridum]SMD26835.1 hypothetical protein SAMN05661093_10422 [Kibdelosporangium aridum]
MPIRDEFDLDVRLGEPIELGIMRGTPPTTEQCPDSHAVTCGGPCCDRSFSCL